MVIEQCAHNQPPVWNTGTTGLESCVSEYTISDTPCLQIPTASNTDQQPGITRSDRVIVALTAHCSHGSGSGSTCMDSRQLVTRYSMQ
jgi:hypothetical protein